LEPEEQEECAVPDVKRQYLMSEQEMKQAEIIEAIFIKFDTDGSGSLDINECVDLFKQNSVDLSPEIIKNLLGGDEFTLQKFKAIISSDADL
jgi:Ca2+-binding EF-hand superfamily protein